MQISHFFAIACSSSPSSTIETCHGSLEGYPVSGSSILGKYSQATLAVDNAE
ncbi:unnamed protein product, partial [Rotaria sordida]